MMVSGVEEEKSTGVERRKWYLQSYKLAGVLLWCVDWLRRRRVES